MSVNKAIIVGHLGQDPELKHTAGGASVVNFSVATSENWTDKQGQKQEKTEWHRIVVWGKQAEICERYLSKGRQVYLEGRIQTRSWEDDKGQKRYMTEINANVVKFLGGGSRDKTQEPAMETPASTTAQNKSNGGMLEQSYNISTDSNFTADDIPF